MSVSSLEFVVLLLVGAAVFFYLPGLRWRQAAFAIASAACLYATVPNGPTWIMLAAFILSGYAAAGVLRKWPSRAFFAAYVTALVVAFLIIKRYVLLDFVLPAWVMAHPLGTIGLSYMLFRQIHFLVDTLQG